MSKENYLKEKIIKSAISIIFVRGIKKTSMEEIARESGVTRVTLYRHFSNKEQLVREVFTGINKPLMQASQSLDTAEKISLQEVFQQITAGLGQLPKGDFPKVIQELKIIYPDIYSVYQTGRKNAVSNIFKFFSNQHPEIQIHPDLNPEVLQAYFMNVVVPFMQNPELVGMNISAEELFNTVQHLFLYGITTRKEK